MFGRGPDQCPTGIPQVIILYIYDCPKLEAIAFSNKQLDTTSAMLASAQGVAAAHGEDGKSALIAGSCSDATASTPVPKLSSSTKPHFLPCLESLRIFCCDGLSEVLSIFLLPSRLWKFNGAAIFKPFQDSWMPFKH